MKSIKFVAIALLAIFVSACASHVYNVENQTVPQVTVKQDINRVKTAILKAGADKGWKMKVVRHDQKSGLIDAVYTRGGHTANVSIPYTNTSYSIVRKSTSGFKYNPQKGTIKRHYNWWVDHLDAAIRINLKHA